MSQAIETEFKNILSDKEFHQLMEKFSKELHYRHLENYYFDTSDKQLQQHLMGLRLRVSDSYAHVTLKQAIKDQPDQLLETTDKIDFKQAKTAIETKTLSEVPGVEKVLNEMGLSLADLHLFAYFQTDRYEVKREKETLVFDHVTFEHFDDYELEMETITSPEEGKKAFKQFLKENHLVLRPSEKKMVRMMRQNSLYNLED